MPGHTLPTRDGSIAVHATTGRPGRPRDASVDKAILSATVSLLNEVGFTGLTMDGVAARARVGKASLYLRWPNKTAMVAEAIRDRTDVVPAVPDTGTLSDDVRSFLRALLRAKRRGAVAVTAFGGELDRSPELYQAWRTGLAGSIVAGFRSIIQRAVDRGELAANTDVDLLSALPLAVLQQWRLIGDRRPDDAFLERIVEQFYTPDSTPRRGQR